MRNPLHSLSKRLTRLRAFPLLVKRQGAYFLLDPRNWIDNRLAAGAPYEQAQLEQAKRLIEEHRLTRLIDVGANVGVYTVLIGRLPAVERVYAFEPVRRNFNQLLGNVFANQLDGKVEAFRLALGAAAGTATIHVDPKSTGVSRLDLAASGRDPSVFSQSEAVAIVRFDDAVALDGARVFLKVDVEGQAHAALSGMARLFAGNYVVVQVELASSEADPVRSLLRDYGLEPAGSVQDDHYFTPKA